MEKREPISKNTYIITIAIVASLSAAPLVTLMFGLHVSIIRQETSELVSIKAKQSKEQRKSILLFFKVPFS